MNKAVRVLHVIPSMGPAYGGPSKVVLGLAPALAKVNVQVDVATTNDNGTELLDVSLGVPHESEGVTTRFFPKQGQGSFVFSWPLTQWLWRHQQEYDLVHIHSIFSYPTLAASRIARRLNQPYVVAPHGMVEPWCLTYKAWKKQPYLKLIEHKTLAGSAALHALVTGEASNLRALKLPTPTFVLPNGVRVEEFSASAPRGIFESQYPETRGKRIVLFMGRIDPKKGLDLLVKAFAEVVVMRDQQRQPVCLVIAGPDLIGYRKTIERLIEEHGIGQHVLFTGMVAGEVKLALLNAADVFVLPSRSEGFSMAILEAMAARCPVIITEACNFPQVAKSVAGKVIPTDAAPQLTEALRQLLGNEAMRGEMGRRGRNLIHREYDWTVIAARLREVYEDILERKQNSGSWST